LAHRTLLVDGSSFSMPDTPALQKHFGQSEKAKPGCGFPVAHLTALFHAGTGLLVEAFAAWPATAIVRELRYRVDVSATQGAAQTPDLQGIWGLT